MIGEWNPQAVKFFAAWYRLLWGYWPSVEPEARSEGLDAIAEAFK